MIIYILILIIIILIYLIFQKITTKEHFSMTFDDAKSYIDKLNLKNYIIPDYTIIAYHDINIPNGWYLCNGKIINGYKIPNLTGRFILGAGQITIDNNNNNTFNLIKTSNIMSPITTSKIASKYSKPIIGNIVSFNLGYYDGDKEHQLTEDELPAHNHSSSYFVKWGRGNITYEGGNTQYMNGNLVQLNNTGGNQAHNNLPPYYCLIYIIKLPLSV